MKPAIVEIQTELLAVVNAVKPANTTLDQYVRELIQADVQRHKSAATTVDYQKLLVQQPEEQAWLDEWEKDSNSLEALSD